MNRNLFIDKWAILLSEKLGRQEAEIRKQGLSAYDFTCGQTVIHKFDDGSYCKFNYAFTVIDAKNEVVAIFTEHCGYHEFSIYACKIIEGDSVVYVHEKYEE